MFFLHFGCKFLIRYELCKHFLKNLTCFLISLIVTFDRADVVNSNKKAQFSWDVVLEDLKPHH